MRGMHRFRGEDIAGVLRDIYQLMCAVTRHLKIHSRQKRSNIIISMIYEEKAAHPFLNGRHLSSRCRWRADYLLPFGFPVVSSFAWRMHLLFLQLPGPDNKFISKTELLLISEFSRCETLSLCHPFIVISRWSRARREKQCVTQCVTMRVKRVFVSSNVLQNTYIYIDGGKSYYPFVYNKLQWDNNFPA